MICLSCGARNTDDAKNCFKCGAGLHAPTITSSATKFTEIQPKHKTVISSRSIPNTPQNRPSMSTSSKAVPPENLPTSRIPYPTMPKSMNKTLARPVKAEFPTSSTMPEPDYVAPPKKSRRLLKIVATILIIGVIIVGGIFAYNVWFKNTNFGKIISNLNPFKKNVEETKKTEETITPTPEEPKPEPKEKTIIEPKKETTKKDSDYDGLTDEQEKKYKTNPNDADTDEDGYPDGLEVKNGYDPSGPGKLKNSSKNTSTIK